MVVNYASSKAGADKRRRRDRRPGGKAVAVQARRVEGGRRASGCSPRPKKAFGRLDILVNNAGVYEFAPLEDVTEAEFHRQFDLNVLGASCSPPRKR